MSKYQTYLSLHEANDAVNASRPLIARLYQMNTLLKKHLKKMQINEHTELSMDDFHQEMTLDSASSVKILLKGIETCLAQLKKQGGRLVSIEKGIIDWPAMINNQPAFYRWHVQKQKIHAWHDPIKNETHLLESGNAVVTEPDSLWQ